MDLKSYLKNFFEVFTFIGALPLALRIALVTSFAAFAAILFYSYRYYSLRQNDSLTTAKQETNIVIVPEENKAWWHMGAQGKKPSMQIVVDGFLTNKSTKDIIIVKSYFKNSNGKLTPPGSVMVRDPSGSPMHGHYILQPEVSTTFRASFWFQPPFSEAGQPIIGDFGFTDQYGVTEWVQGVHFAAH